MQNLDYDFTPYLESMGIPNEMYPMLNMPDNELREMYPEIYDNIYPEVVRQSDTCDNTYGPMYMPSIEDVEDMVDNIANMGENMNVDIQPASADAIETQRLVRRGGVLRDLAGILLIRELLRRRRRPYYPRGYGVPRRGYGVPRRGYSDPRRGYGIPRRGYYY